MDLTSPTTITTTLATGTGDGWRRLWVDDLRPAPDGWTWVKTSREAIDALSTQLYGEMSLDHDLGGDDTARRVVLWMCENDCWPKIIRIHTQNPIGHEWLTGMANRYGPGVSR